MALSAGSSSVKSLGFIRRLFWEKLVIIIVLFGLFPTQAAAASFDCHKAASWLEKTVCTFIYIFLSIAVALDT